MSLNRVELIGLVSIEPRVTTFDNGGKVANMGLATKERGYTTKDGKEVPDHTEFHNLVINKLHLINLAEGYISKGDMLYVSGKIRSRTYGEDNRKAFDIIVDTIEVLDWSLAPAPNAVPQKR